MNEPLIAWAILAGFMLLGSGFGYLAGQANPPKGEIILTTFEPHKCKGMPKAHNWYKGTQWQCATCKDVWEVSTSYDGFNIENYWKRLNQNIEKPESPQTADKAINDTNQMDYSDFVTIKITKVSYMGRPTHWEVEVDEDGMGGTAPNFGGVVDIAMSLICGEYGEEDWHKFDANEESRKR